MASQCEPGEVFRRASLLVRGSVTSVGEPIKYEDSYWNGTLEYRVVELAVDDTLAAAHVDQFVGKDVLGAVDLLTVTLPDGDVVDYRDVDWAKSLFQDDTLMLLEPFETSEGIRPRLVAAFDDSANGWISFGRCGDRALADLTSVAKISDQPIMTVLQEWIVAELDEATRLTRFETLLEAAGAAEATDAAVKQWNETPVTSRSLRPSDVPEGISLELSVVAVQLDLRSSGEVGWVTVSSDSGVSAIVHRDTLPTVVPVFYALGDQTIFIRWSESSIGDPSQTLATIPIAKLGDSLGLEIVGDSTSAKWSLLSSESLASLLKVDANSLAQLREQLLAG